MKKYVGAMLVLVFVLTSSLCFAAGPLTCWFPPGWKTKADQAEKITTALSEKSGLTIHPQIATGYPEILSAFAEDQASLVYVGSFVQAIIAARKLGTPLVQNANGKEMYSGILIFPDGQDPDTILQNSPVEIAYAIGASSGESSAKAATGGKAAIGVASHADAVKEVQEGRAKAAVVKNWWWESNSDKYPGLKSFNIPNVSLVRNPDNVLTASRSVSTEVAEILRRAALQSREAFGKDSVILPFQPIKLSFSLGLMKQGGIDPMTYDW